MWIRLEERAPCTAVPGRGVAYRRHGGGRSHRVELLDRAFALITARHELRELDRRWALLYRAEMHQRAGRRRSAASLYLAVARECRDPRSLVRAVVAFLAPSAIVLRDFRARTLTRRSHP